MDARFIALKLYLEAIGFDIPENPTVDDMRRMQCLVYLAQQSGATLGYDFGWYPEVFPKVKEGADDQ